MGRKFRMYVEEVGDDGSEFKLVFEVGEEKTIKTEYCIEDCLYESSTFLYDNCEKYEFDSRFDSLEININYKMGK